MSTYEQHNMKYKDWTHKENLVLEFNSIYHRVGWMHLIVDIIIILLFDYKAQVRDSLKFFEKYTLCGRNLWLLASC